VHVNIPDVPLKLKTAFLKKHWMTLMLGIMLAGVSARDAHAQGVVGTCIQGAQYPAIQAAVNAAPSGAVIKVVRADTRSKW